MPLKQDWPTPVTYPEYIYKFKFTPADVDFEGDPNDPSNPPMSFAELFEDLTLNAKIEGTEEDGYHVTGEGIFDKMMETAQLHLKAQFMSNRIRKENYADEHLQMYLGTLQMFQASFIQFEIERMRLQLQLALENMKAELQLQMARESNESAERQNTERIDAQAPLLAAQVETEYEKKNLHRRQIESFDEDFKQKLLKINMDAWAVGFSVARDNPDISIIPAPMKAAAIDSLYNTKILPDIDNNTYYRAKSTLGTVDMEH